jgi:WD40 repeat protein/tetratricopeptide (TPR) repeat protein
MDQTARLWDTKTGNPASPPLRHVSGVIAADFDPDGRFVLSRDLDGERRLWDLYQSTAPGRMFAFLEGSDSIGQIEFSPDGKFVAAIQQNGRVQVCDAVTGAAISPMMATRSFNDGRPVISFTFSPNSQALAVLGPDGDARVYDARTGALLLSPLHHPKSASINRVLFSPDGRRLYTAGDDGQILCWDARTGQRIGEPLKNDPPLKDIALSRDGRWLAVTERASAGVWDLPHRRFVRMQGDPGWLPGDRLAFRPDSKAILCWGIEVIPSSARRRMTLAGHHMAVEWEAATGRILARMPHSEWIVDAAYSPDGKRIATAIFSGNTFLWDAATGRPATPPLEHKKVVRSVRFSPDGALVVTASLDASVRLWDAATGELVAEQHDPSQVTACTNVAVSPDGRRVAVGGWLGAALWDLPKSPGTNEETQLLARVLSCSRSDPNLGAVSADAADIRGAWEALNLRQASYVARPLTTESELLWRQEQRQADTGQLAAAVITCTALLEQTPNDPRVLNERARVHILKGDFADAADDLDQFARVRKDPIAVPEERAVLYAVAGDENRYQRFCREVYPLTVPRFQETGYKELRFLAFAPDALDGAGYDDAIRLLRQALASNAGGAETEEALIGLLYRSGRYGEAVEALEKGGGAAAKGAGAGALFFGAMAHARLGQAAEARQQMALADAWLAKNSGSIWAWPQRFQLRVLGREAERVLHEQGVAFDPIQVL